MLSSLSLSLSYFALTIELLFHFCVARSALLSYFVYLAKKAYYYFISFAKACTRQIFLRLVNKCQGIRTVLFTMKVDFIVYVGVDSVGYLKLFSTGSWRLNNKIDGRDKRIIEETNIRMLKRQSAFSILSTSFEIFQVYKCFTNEKNVHNWRYSQTPKSWQWLMNP